jgi:O-antigen/teichoic acid export membrane protein
MIAFVAGHAINYALMWAANHLLDSGGFGLFYTSILIINVLFSPVMAVLLVLARRLADEGAKQGRGQVVAMTWYALGNCLRALPAVAAVAALLAVGSWWLGFEAWPIAFLIPLTVLALVVTEILRTSFQGMLLFGWQSAVWVVSNAAQFAGAIGALWLIPRVWLGICGILAGALVTFAAFVTWFVRAARALPATTSAVTLNLVNEWPMIVGYSLFIVMNNMDIFAGYLLLPRDQLDVYAASSLLSKAITTMTFAVAQVTLPVIVDQKADGLSYRQSIAKAIAMTVGLGAAAAAVLWVAVPWVQATPLAIRGLDFPIMMTLAIAAIALGAIRVFVIVEVALQRYAVGIAQVGAMALFGLICGLAGAPALRLAELYAAITSGFLVIVAIALITPRPIFSGFFQSHAR